MIGSSAKPPANFEFWGFNGLAMSNAFTFVEASFKPPLFDLLSQVERWPEVASYLTDWQLDPTQRQFITRNVPKVHRSLPILGYFRPLTTVSVYFLWLNQMLITNVVFGGITFHTYWTNNIVESKNSVRGRDHGCVVCEKRWI